MNKTLLVVFVVAAFGAGNLTGFFLGVATSEAGQKLIEDLATSEAPADVDSPHEITRDGFALEYPGNWKIDVEDSDYDPDYTFSIDSPGSCYVYFMFMDTATDAGDNVDAQEAGFSEFLGNATAEELSTWGGFEGEGVRISGRIMGFRGGVRIFSHSTDTRSFIVVEQYYDEDLAHVQPGFDLIAESFELR